MNITRQWRKVLAVGCSHGLHADPVALRAVLDFRERLQPDEVLHLGDFCDTAAFLGASRGTPAGGESVQPDLDSGLEFLTALRPTCVLCGNHEDRLWQLMHSRNSIVQYCASQCIATIKDKCEGLGAKLIPYDGLRQGVKLGGYTYLHGCMYGENAVRDHAESLGNCVHAHTHRPGVAKGRRSDNPTGYCVGTLASIPAMEYAKNNRSTLSWSGGMVWGEFCEDQSQLWLHEQPAGATEWRLP
jgi:Calcineurin-like phosphoesterase